MLSLFRHPPRPLTPIESLEALIKRNLARNPDFYGNAETRRARGAEPQIAPGAGYFLTADELRDVRPARAQGHSNTAFQTLARMYDVQAATVLSSDQFRAMTRAIETQTEALRRLNRRPPALNVKDPRPHVPIEDQILLREGIR